MNQYPVKSDSRYTVTKEHTGHASGPRYVVRFCGQRIDCRASYSAAVVLAVGDKARRNGALCFEDVKA